MSLSRLLWLVPAVFLSACVTNERTYLRNGVAVNEISCKLRVDSLARCYRAAGEMCGPRGYVIFDWDGTEWPRPYPDPSSMDADTMLRTSTILVACRPPPPVRLESPRL